MTPLACPPVRAAVPVPGDPRLPQLATALDVSRMAPLLPFPDSVAKQDVRVSYVRYKPGTNCIVLYEIPQRDGPPLWAYAKLFAEGVDLKTDASRVSSYHPEHRMALLRFPLDLEIPSLRFATSPTEADQFLSRVAGPQKRHRFAAHWGLWTPVRYKPERRCVMRGIYDDPHRSGVRGFYARFYGPREGVKTPLWHRHFKKLKDSRVRVPRYLASSRRRRTLLVAEQEGEPLRAFFSRSQSDLEAATETAAKALANWHRLTPPPEAPLLNSDAGQLQAAARTVDVLLEDSAIGAAALASQLIRATPPADGPALLHGDFYYDQLLLWHDTACFLDLDELGVGDPVRDVANFCAHLKLLEVRGEISGSVSDPVCERFVETYQSAAGRRIPPSRLAWHLSAALLQLVVLPFRRFDPEWPRQLKLIIELARSAARGASC